MERFPATRAIHFGETVYLAFAHSGGHSYFVRPSAQLNPGGLAKAETLSAGSGGVSPWKIVDPLGLYKIGERVPMGRPIAFKSMTARLHQC